MFGVTVMELPLGPSPSPMVLLSGMFHVTLYKPPGGSTLQVRDTTPEASLSSAMVTCDGEAKTGEEGVREGDTEMVMDSIQH